MARTYNKNISSTIESSFELDLAPMLALMVTLIPIMLLSTVFVRVTIIDTPLPQVVQKALEEDRNKKDRIITVALDMKDNGFTLQLKSDGKVVKNIELPKKGDGWDLAGLHTEVVRIKKEHPDVFRMDLNPEKVVPYSEIVKVMDEVRQTRSEDPKIYILDKQTNQHVETDLMFPDVVFANVVEG
ncbi:MAG: biopolymer transporter ExbD [Bdellovibrionaceae bacterium]|nr:biopolymer transporter ExbD [Bdellovibrionales bacterium]MCB9084733.1 biopolymer transporter ExbD [Pseudobdellovibrionaceae bacterium]